MFHDNAQPSLWVLRWAHLVRPGGKVLDLACGAGRHARLFASLGCEVTACDRDAEALATLSGVKGVTTLRADLEDGSPWPFAPGQFDAVIVCNYLYRPLFAAIADALAPNGALVYETFLLGNERHGKPSNPRFLLERDELLAAFSRRLVVAGFEQGRMERGKTALIQHLCALQSAGLEHKLEA